MKVLIGGTPLESMGWQVDLDKVRLVWREGTEPAKQLVFLTNLITSARAERDRIIQETFG
ncbi:hypothetical protein [Mesorhizobium sp. STM 4661]|uniref:hypothetical protein n=1 Tax=Mesorhizobium sp. STM 4661 TaxID=1297570 RepID=UPI0012FC2123|nr:hypothetical protein [Mesorhizobium sp. STM 4661]